MSSLEIRRISVDLARFSPLAERSALFWNEAPAVVGPCVESLRAEIARIARPDESVRVGRVVSSSHQSECAVFLEAGPTAGAAANIFWRCATPRVGDLRVVASSPGQRRWAWSSLGVGFVAGIVFAYFVLPWTIDPTLLLIAGLCAGVAVGVGSVFTVIRLRLGIDEVRAGECAQRVAGAVDAWIDAHDARLPAFPRTGKSDAVA